MLHDGAYSLSIRVQTTLNHIRFVKLKTVKFNSYYQKMQASVFMIKYGYGENLD